MLKLRSNDLADFEHYLQVRSPASFPRSKKPVYRRLMGLGLAGFAMIPLLHLNVEAFAVDGALTLAAAALWFRSPGKFAITPDQELLIRANRSADLFRQLLRSRRLKSSLHPGVATVINECAHSWRRIVAINQLRIWSQADVASHWNASREDWTRAADFAMAEALTLSESSVTLRGPRSRAEEVIEDVIDNFVPIKGMGNLEPLPIQFRDIRDLADKLQILAREVEAISRTIQAEPIPANQGNASRRLEEVLSQMQDLRKAEEELHQRA